MSKAKRILALLLSALMLSSAAACSESTVETESGSKSAAESGSASETETSIEYLDDLPDDLNFEGAEIRFLAASGYGTVWVNIEEDDMSDPVVEASWKKNNILEDRLNVKIVEPYTISKDDFNATAKNSVQANSDDYDIYKAYARFNMEIAAEGMMKNLDKVNYLDFSKNYWNEQYVENLTYNNIIYWSGGSISNSYIGNARVLFANMSLWNRYFPSDDLYEMVMSGNWVLDEFKTRIQNIYVDSNGDGLRGLEDTYGFVSDTGAGTTNCLMFGAGMAFTKYDYPGVPALDIDSEHNLAVFDFYHNFLYNDTNVLYGDAVGGLETEVFARGDVLFLNSQVGWIDDNIRNMEDDFYLIPAPKYDTLQEEYRVTQQDGFKVVGIPITVSEEKIDAVGAALEGMASLASSLVYPAYYETTLKDKYSRSPEAQELVDLIYDSIIADFCLGWCDSVGYMGNSTLQIYASNIMRDSITSVLAKNMKVYEKGLAQLLENFDAYIDN